MEVRLSSSPCASLCIWKETCRYERQAVHKARSSRMIGPWNMPSAEQERYGCAIKKMKLLRNRKREPRYCVVQPYSRSELLSSKVTLFDPPQQSSPFPTVVFFPPKVIPGKRAESYRVLDEHITARIDPLLFASSKDKPPA